MHAEAFQRQTLPPDEGLGRAIAWAVGLHLLLLAVLLVSPYFKWDRERLNAAKKRFNANDNIADFIEPGELEQLLDEVTQKMEGVLSSMVIDTERDPFAHGFVVK